MHLIVDQQLDPYQTLGSSRVGICYVDLDVGFWHAMGRMGIMCCKI